MKVLKFLILSAAVAFAISSGVANAGPSNVFTISGGTPYTLPPTSDGTPIPVGTTGFVDALLTISHKEAFKFEFLGCGDTIFENRFYVAGSHKFFDCKTSKVGDSFTVKLKVDDFGPHSPFHFQAAAKLSAPAANFSGPSVFNGEGPLYDSYTNGFDYCNESIFYTIEGSTGTSGNAVLLGLADGGICPKDIDYQDLDVRISLVHEKEK